jgi:hypothetical protein
MRVVVLSRGCCFAIGPVLLGGGNTVVWDVVDAVGRNMDSMPLLLLSREIRLKKYQSLNIYG